MKKLLTTHTGYYLSLIILFLTCLILVIYNSGQLSVQMTIIVMTSFLFVVWGILHHTVKHTTSLKVVIEYVLMGMVGMAIAILLVS